MRDVNRIDPFCNELAEIWKKSFPDWRFGQLMFNFFGWVQNKTKTDSFYIEDGRMSELLKEYAKIYGYKNR